MSETSETIFKYAVTFCMKSGNTFTLYCNEFEYESNAGKVVSWSAQVIDSRFGVVNLAEVEFLFMEQWNKPKGQIMNK